MHNFHQGDPDCILGTIWILGCKQAYWKSEQCCPGTGLLKEKGCRTLSLGSDLRHIGDVSELAYYRLRVFQMLPRRSAWESSGESLLWSRTVTTEAKGLGKGGTEYTFHGNRCRGWRKTTWNSPGNPWAYSPEKE